jgi:large subunit ribosomal protein L10
LAISKARKDELVAQYKELVEQSRAIFLTEYTGMSVKGMEALRKEVRTANGAFYVTKNTLLQTALQQADMPAPADLLIGQTATGFALEEVPAMAKALVDYADKEDAFVLKGGILGDDLLSVEQIEALANLPSLDQLRAQIVGLINAPAQGIVSLVTNGVRQIVNVVDAYAKSEDAPEAA